MYYGVKNAMILSNAYNNVNKRKPWSSLLIQHMLSYHLIEKLFVLVSVFGLGHVDYIVDAFKLILWKVHTKSWIIRICNHNISMQRESILKKVQTQTYKSLMIIFSVILGVTSTGQLKDEGGVDLFSKVYKGQKGGLNIAFLRTLWMLPWVCK